MTDAATVLVDNDGPVRIVTLNRPDSMNAFNGDVHDELIRVLRVVGRDRDARAIVLTGAGRAFSAGGDIDHFEVLANDYRLAALPWQAVQDTKFVLNQHLRQAWVTALGFGFAAESQSHDTAEYRAVPDQFRVRVR